MHLSYDLFSVDKKMLFRAGQEITPHRMRAVALHSDPIRLHFVRDTSLFTDLQGVFKDKRYATILSPPRVNRRILGWVRKVVLPETIVRELRNIKRTRPYTYRHILRSAVLSTKLSLDEQLKKVYDPALMARLSLVHDLGKSRIPAEILDKETPLTAKEFAILKTHPLCGYLLLRHYCGQEHRHYDYACYEHHEKLDGSGYPRHVRKIKRYSQVIAVVDVLDALISSRPYRKEGYTLRAALDHLLDEGRKGKMNLKIVRLMVAQARRTKPHLRALRLSKIKRDAPPRENLYGTILPEGPEGKSS
jgi:HD-GYP domain-containing protein (c-di-GMP phosphodiesterase class II)